MNNQTFPKLIALVLAFFLLSGFSLVGPDYKELYRLEKQKAQNIQEQLDNYKPLKEENKQLRQENKQLTKENSSLETENELLKGGLDPLQKALVEKEKQLNQRQEELNQDRQQLIQDRAELNAEIRKVGQLEGEIQEIRQDKKKLTQTVRELKEEKQKQENGKNGWKNVTLIENTLIVICGIIYIVYFFWRQNQSKPYPQQQTIDLGESSTNNKQFSPENQENKSLPTSEGN